MSEKKIPVVLTLESDTVIKSIIDAVKGEDSANDKWVKAASNLYMAGVRHADLPKPEKGQAVSEKYTKVRDIVIRAQPERVIHLITAGSTIGFTEQERSDRRFYTNRVDNIHMSRIREHLKKFEDSERGASARKTFGEVLAGECQEMIDRIRRAKEDRIDFDATEAVVALKELKAIFNA